MSATFALIASLATGAVVGAVLRSRLATTRYRLPDELDLPRPASWWVIPMTAAVTALVWWAIAPGRPIIVPAVYVLAVWTMVVLAFGVVVGLVVPGEDPVSPVLDATATAHLAEVTVIISLMGVGLALERPLHWRTWSPTWPTG